LLSWEQTLANWGEILQEILAEQARGDSSAFDTVRRRYLERLHVHTGRNVIAYYSGFLSKPRIEGVGIDDDDKNGFMQAIHLLDRTKGLDLILHTPGGAIAATESLAHYLKQMFGSDIRAIVPQIAMSAGTMLALSCKKILMGKHSNLGPIDPQIFGFPALGVLREFQRARDEIITDPRTAEVWRPILSHLSPAFLDQCELARKWSRDFVTKSLMDNMFLDFPDRIERATRVVDGLSDLEDNKAHDKHLHFDKCEALGISVLPIEEDQKLQDLVLTVHHCYMHTLSNTATFKIIENQIGAAMARQIAFASAAPALP
jgi:hypothetical protein